MSGIPTLFLLLNAAALLALPRRWAPLPLLMGTCYMTLGLGIVLGPFHFPVLRLLILVGVVRVLVRGERPAGGLNGLDWVMVAWATWALFSSAFVQSFVGQAGVVYNTLGIYFLIRTFCQSLEDIVHLVKITALLLAPVALEMVNELLTGRNLFAVLGGVQESVVVRGERLRAQGPFSHAILAGTVGAATFPLIIGIWRRHPQPAKVGLAACLVMVYASASSGPLMSVIFGVFALVMWRWRHITRQMRIAAVIGYILLDLVMKAPAYFLIARIDLTGSSTGWHRPELMRVAYEHLDEWWFAGTTYTRHWMPYGVSWSEDHCDITNQYIFYGVFGGLPLMLLFIAALWMAFRDVGRFVSLRADDSLDEVKFVWALGSALFAQAVSCFSVYYFDQSFVFLFLNLAVIGSLRAAGARQYSAKEPVEFDSERTLDTPNVVGRSGVGRNAALKNCGPVLRAPPSSSAPSDGAVGSERNDTIELLRVVAACGVIWFHMDSTPFKRFGYAGLVFFLIVSVIFQKGAAERGGGHNYFRKRSSKLLIPWAAWFVIYGLLNLVTGKSLFPYTSSFLQDIYLRSLDRTLVPAVFCRSCLSSISFYQNIYRLAGQKI